jgi:hypothetical protein
MVARPPTGMDGGGRMMLGHRPTLDIQGNEASAVVQSKLVPRSPVLQPGRRRAAESVANAIIQEISLSDSSDENDYVSLP